MEDNLVNIVLYSFDKFTQNRHVYYQQNGDILRKKEARQLPFTSTKSFS